jgi:hypothetical protein
VKTKCGPSDDNTVTIRATEDATSLKGPASLEDHDALAVGVENKHEKLKLYQKL